MATNLGRKFFICSVPQPTDITDPAVFAALTWVEVGGVGKVGETGTSTNIVSYDTMDTKYKRKDKGISDAGDPVLEVMNDYTDAGQIILRTIAKTNFKYATKTEMADSPDGILSNTIRYNRGIVNGPKEPEVGPEDFDLAVYSFGYEQEQVIVDPA